MKKLLLATAALMLAAFVAVTGANAHDYAGDAYDLGALIEALKKRFPSLEENSDIDVLGGNKVTFYTPQSHMSCRFSVARQDFRKVSFSKCHVISNARTFHYACSKGEDRYALTVNEDRRIVKLIRRSPTDTVATFRIVKVTPECAKYGWELNDGAKLCTATQGVGTLDWHGQEYDCDQADTE